jgi:DNA-binding MarR family transcriptional regulator
MRDRSKSVKGQSVEGHPVDEVPPEGTNVLFDVWLVSRAATGVLDEALAGTCLTADEFEIYSVLMSADTLTPSELARWTSAPPTTVSSYVKRLESRGHLERLRNPADGRSYVLQLTDEGRRAHRSAGEAFLPVLAQVVEQLGTRERTVRRGLDLLRRSLDHVNTSAGREHRSASSHQ